MKHRNEAREISIKWTRLVKLHIGRKIKELHRSVQEHDPFQRLCLKQGIQRYYFSQGAKGMQLDDVAESMEHTLVRNALYDVEQRSECSSMD